MASSEVTDTKDFDFKRHLKVANSPYDNAANKGLDSIGKSTSPICRPRTGGVFGMKNVISTQEFCTSYPDSAIRPQSLDPKPYEASRTPETNRIEMERTARQRASIEPRPKEVRLKVMKLLRTPHIIHQSSVHSLKRKHNLPLDVVVEIKMLAAKALENVQPRPRTRFSPSRAVEHKRGPQQEDRYKQLMDELQVGHEYMETVEAQVLRPEAMRKFESRCQSYTYWLENIYKPSTKALVHACDAVDLTKRRADRRAKYEQYLQQSSIG